MHVCCQTLFTSSSPWTLKNLKGQSDVKVRNKSCSGMITSKSQQLNTSHTHPFTTTAESLPPL